jgi:NAD-dependent SIR2 family protein deacetylase
MLEGTPIALPQELIDALLSQSCVPFLGAGFSVEAGVITARDLSIELCNRLGYRIGENVPLSISAALFESVKSTHALRQYLVRRIQETGTKPGQCHRILADLLRQGLFTTVISTNWDNLLEQACQLDFDMKTILHDTTLPYLGGHKAVVIKYHGSVDRAASLVVTDQDAQDFLDGQRGVVTKLQAVMQENTIVFIGFSLSDHDFRRIHYEVRRICGRHGRRWFLVCPKPDGTSSADWQLECLHYWKPQNVEVIPVRASVFLEQLTLVFPKTKGQ